MLRKIRTESTESEEKVPQTEEEEEFDFKKAGLVALIFISTLVVGYLAFVAFDYFDTLKNKHEALRKIERIADKVKDTNPIRAQILEDYEFDLSQLRIEYSGNKAINTCINEVNEEISNHLALVPSGTIINSWATSKQVKSEIDTIQVVYKDRHNYQVKKVTIPVTPIESRAYNLLEAHPVWGKDTCLSIAQAKVWIGMSKEQLLLSRGQPKYIDRKNSANIKSEQWAYGNLGPYFYLENGILISMQD